MKYFKKLAFIFLLYGGLVIFLFSTSPAKLSISWLLLPFMWLFVALFLTIILLGRLIWPPRAGSSTKKRYSAAATLAALPCILLLLDSVNQLTPKDGLLLVGLGVGVVFYVSRMSP